MSQELNKEMTVGETEDNKIEFKKVQSPKESSMMKFSKALKGPNGGYIKTILLMVLTAPILFYGIYSTSLPKVKTFKADQETMYHGTELDVSMNKKDLSLNYDVKHATLKLDENKYLEVNGDILKELLETDLNVINDKFTNNGLEYTISTDLRMSTFDCYNGFLLSTYYNKENTGGREFILSTELIPGLDIAEMESVDGRIFEKNSATSVSAFLESYDNSVIYYSDKIAGGEFGTKTLSGRMQGIEDRLAYSSRGDAEKEEVIVNIEELRQFKLSDISVFESAPGVYFSEADGVLRFYNYKDDVAYMFMSYVNNTMFFCNATDLLETNYDNLFVTKGFDDQADAGYRTFVITTDNNMYAFRINSDVDDSVLTEILAYFGYDRDTLTIKTVQEVISGDIVENTISENSLENITDGEEVSTEETVSEETSEATE